MLKYLNFWLFMIWIVMVNRNKYRGLQKFTLRGRYGLKENGFIHKLFFVNITHLLIFGIFIGGRGSSQANERAAIALALFYDMMKVFNEGFFKGKI